MSKKFGVWLGGLALMWLGGCVQVVPPAVHSGTGSDGVGRSGVDKKVEQPLTVCLPQAVAVKASALVVPVDVEVKGQRCSLEKEESFSSTKSAGERLSRRTRYVVRGNEVEKRFENRDGVLSSREVYRRDQAGRWVEKRRYDAKGELVGKLELGYDEAGNLTKQRNWSRYRSYGAQNGWRENSTEVRQVWAGSKLLQRSHEDSRGRSWTYQWKYDTSGRLVDARLTSATNTYPEQRARWSYKAGRPTMLVREYKGEEVMRQRWSWSAAGKLQKREIELKAPSTRHWGHALDDQQWLGTSPQPAVQGSEKGCAPLPVAWGEGYQEDAYTPGWTGKDAGSRLLLGIQSTPDGVNAYSSYGYYGYYGAPVHPLRYNHDGFQQRYSYYYYGYSNLSPFKAGESYRLEISYDASGRMTQELLLGWKTSETAPTRGEHPRKNWRSLRERSFVGGLLHEDRLADFAEGEVQNERKLVFFYDAAGRLTRRELRQDVALREVQKWSYDAAGRLSSHLIAGQPLNRREQTLVPPQEHVRFAFRYDAKGKLTHEELDWSQENQRNQSFTYGYDAAGKRTEFKTVFAGQKPRIEILKFDAAGRQVSRSMDNNGDGEIDYLQTHLYFGDVLVLRETRYSSGSNRDVYKYQCTP